MRVALFSTKPADREFFGAANARLGHELVYFEPRLTVETAAIGATFPAVCAFVNDHLSQAVLRELHGGGTRLTALRSAGFNHVDLDAARELELTVVRVPAYSPHAVAEHAAGLILTLNRKLHRAYNRVREGNFALDGLLGFVLHGRTVGIIGTGQIGTAFARIMAGLGCRLLAHDLAPNAQREALGARYVPLPALFAESDIIALHCPLTPETYHLIDAAALEQMRPGVMLINTSRGALVDTPAAIGALKSGKLGYFGLDVYEEEEALFFQDHSGRVITDDVFARLMTFPNVIVTGHQGFFTREAMESIAETTLANITAFERDEGEMYRVPLRQRV
ncbi:MAG TPA: 2-hydroxyacid dehydrogenase [Longimicrobiaceae bacterium]|nr:2-hydroxyacid dehydrogenase [Longimicrobiaceae bacterium]